MNYDLKTLTDIQVNDPILGNQNLIEDSVTIHYANLGGGSNQAEKGDQVDEGDYTLTIADGSINVHIHGETERAYWIEFKTSLEGELIEKEYNNLATVSSEGREDIHLDNTVSINHGGSYVEKSGLQSGSVIDWKIDINAGQSFVQNAAIKDEQSADQILLEDSFALYSTNVNERGVISKADPLVKGEDYTIEIDTADDGSQTFDLAFNDDIDEAYILEYQSFINTGNGETVSNSVTFSGENITTETVESGESIVVRQTGGGGTGSGERGSLEVIKVDAIDNEKVLDGAVFTLFDSEGEIELRTVETAEDGRALFNNLRYGDYILIESEAPEGYVVGIEDEKSVTVDAESTTVMIENEQITQAVELTKQDSETGEVLEGAEFSIKHVMDGEETLIANELMTDDEGKILVEDLDPGSYYFVETEAPEGYVLNEEPVVFEIIENQTTVTTVTKSNDIIKGSAELLKVASHNGEPLAGAVFELRTEDDEVIREDVMSNEEGVVLLEGLRPSQYKLVETKAPDCISWIQRQFHLR